MVLPGLPTIRLLENLPQRPPTPPREADHSSAGEGTSVIRRIFSENLAARTPPSTSPECSAESDKRTSSTSHKKVGWSAWTEYKESPHIGSALQQKLRELPPSGKLKPAKSILKPYNGVNTIDRRSGVNKFAAPHTYPNFAAMLESIVKQLAGEDRSSRIDAYLTLSGALKASDNVPDPRALKEKIGLLSQFIQRDILARNGSGAHDSVLINNALTLLSFFVWKPAVAGYLSVEFCAHFVDYAISAFEDPSVPKDVVKHFLFIIGQQNFSTRIMTSDRIRWLIESVSGIQNHVKGRSIVLGRIGLYRKLLKQARSSMLANLGWLENVFTDMTSGIKDIRGPAVALGFEAALSLGTEKQASRAVMELFQREHDDVKYANYYAKRLDSMILNKQDGDLVPQIWSVVVLFLRFRPHQLEQWEFMTPWLHIIEKCFNSYDYDIKIQANFAWNRLVFAINLNEETAPSMIKMLSKVLSVQLRRKPVGRHAKDAKQIAIGSVCNLLYYAMRPNAIFAQLDLYWDEYVHQLIGGTLVLRDQQNSETGHEDLAHACDIVGALLDTSPKPWINNRTNEIGIVKVEEIPGIDPKWTRKNAPRVFKVLGPIIEKCFQNLARWEDTALLLWSRLVASVAAAGVKEVKVSNDTMSSLACMFDVLYRLWDHGPTNPSDDSNCQQFQKVFSLLVTTITTNLGVLPFTEKLLLLGPQENFAVVSTPSHHPSRASSEAKTPLNHLFALMSRPSAGVKYDDAFLAMVKEVLLTFFDTRRSRRSRIELVKDLAQLIPHPSFVSNASIILWRALAGYAILALDYKSQLNGNGNGSHEQPLGAEYRNIVKILELGINLSPGLLLPDWKALFIAATGQITVEAGESGRAISIIEPLTRVLEQRVPDANLKADLSYCIILLSSAVYPREKQSLDVAKRRLWGTTITGSRTSIFDPFLRLYAYVQHCLEEAYISLASDGWRNATELLSNIAGLIQRCPTMHLSDLLKNMQQGLAIWLVDHDLSYGGLQSSEVANAVENLWSKICRAIEQIPHANSCLLRDLEPLICAGLESKHKSTVRDAIRLWNFSFGLESTLEYPSRIIDALHRLRPVANLQLPSFPDDSADEIYPGTSFLEESQDDSLSNSPVNSGIHRYATIGERSPHLKPSPLPQLKGRSSAQSLVEIHRSVKRKRPFEITPEPRRKVAKKEITPKLRHDDSQIQFATIDSSPFEDATRDLQLLTDRQREVKQRQIEACSLFVNDISSPCHGVQSRVSKFILSSDHPTAQRDFPDRPITSSFERHDNVPLDDYITSSPTAHLEFAGIELSSDVFEPPSSPPEQASPRPHLTAVSKFTPSQDSRTGQGNGPQKQTPPPRATSPHLVPEETNQEVPAPSIEHLKGALGHEQSVLEGCTTVYSPLSNSERPATPAGISNALGGDERGARTPKEVFVDALSSPAPPTPARDTNSEDPYVDAANSPPNPLGIQRAASETDYAAGSLPNHTKQDSQILYSLSDADEDSMLKLITRYDVGPSQEDHAESDVGVEDANNNENSTFEGNYISSTTNMGDEQNSAAPQSKKSKPNAALPSTVPETPHGDSVALWVGSNSQKVNSVESDGAGKVKRDSTRLRKRKAVECQSSEGTNRTRVKSCEIDVEMANDEDQPEEGGGQTHRRPVEVPDKAMGTAAAGSALGPEEAEGRGRRVVSGLEEILATLQKVALTREEAGRVENILWDVKGELYAAEKRGRKGARG